MEDVGTANNALPAVSPLAGEPIKHADAERLARVLKAFANPARLRLLRLIQSAPGDEASPTSSDSEVGGR